MAITEAQATVHVQGNGDPVNLAYGSNVTLGNWLAVCVTTFDQDYTVGITGTAAITAVTGGAGAFDQIVASNASSTRARTRIYYTKVTTAGTCTVSVNPAASTDVSIVAFELAGADSTDAKDDSNGAGATGTSTTPDSGNLAATSAADGLIIGMMTHIGGSVTITKGADFTEEAEDETVDRMPYNCESRGFGGGLASSTTDSANWTTSGSVEWVAVAASFKAAAGAAAAVNIGVIGGGVGRKVIG